MLKSSLFMLVVLSAASLSALGQRGPAPTPSELRLLPSEFDFGQAAAGGTGTSGVTGIRTVVLKGDPDKSGLYTIMLSVPPHTKILAHDHPDDRVATVVSGIWQFGYGKQFDQQKLKALTPGSFYTEPAGTTHFAQTGETSVILHITGVGPSGLQFTGVEKSDK